MIPVTSFAGRKVALFGLGGSGKASASRCSPAAPMSWRSTTVPSECSRPITPAFQPRICARSTGKIAALVLSPGVPLTHPAPHWMAQLARAAGVEVIGDIELFCRERRVQAPDAEFIAITGTNGKSTTTALIAHILKTAEMDVQLGGNIGTAILSLEPPRSGRTYVIECSSYQIDLAPTLDPSVGVWINLTEDHIDRHGTISNYAAVKERLLAGVPNTGTVVIGVDDQWCKAAADQLEAAGKQVVRISVRHPLENGVYVDGEQIMEAAGGKAHPLALLSKINSLRGIHNAQNAACAAAAALAAGLDGRAIQRGLWSFPGLPHRMEEVGRKGNVLFVNDSKATNANSTAQALACFHDVFWILGGKAKTGGITSLTHFFPRIRKAYLIGEAAAQFATTLAGNVEHEIVETLDRAVAGAAADAEASGLRDAVVLLSPACASFDQYTNFEVRGDTFRSLVKAIPDLQPPQTG